MAEPTLPGSIDKEDEEDEEEETTGKGKGKTRGSYGDICPHKAFPLNVVDRKLLKTQKDYTNFLLKNPREGHPWYIPPEKIKMKPRREESFKWLAQARKLKLRAKPPEESQEKEFDMSKYIIMERTDKKKKKKKKTTTKVSKIGYEIKVNKELAFLLDVMANSKEVMVQKAIDYQRKRDEEEKKAKEEGDIKVLKTIVQGMMLKVMNEFEESQNKKPPKRKGKNDKKKRKKDEIEEKDKAVEDENLLEKKGYQLQLKKMNAKTTIELVSFLKDLVEHDKKKKESTSEDKSVSPYVSEEFESSVIVEETEEIVEEEEEVEEDEEPIEDEEEEEGEGEPKEDEEGVVDMEEVKKKLESIKENEEEEEQFDEEQEEGEQEKLEPENLNVSESTSSVEINAKPSMSDKSAQFNYFEERKALLEKKPKNITDDLAHFLKAVMMADDDMREVMKEKELLEFKRKQLDFMTMGMFLQKPEKCKKTKKGKHDKKGKKVKGKVADIPKDLSYNVRPNEFMLMLQVVMNSLDAMDEQKQLEEKTRELLTLLENRPSIESSSSKSSSSQNSEEKYKDDDEIEEDSEEGEDDEEEDEEEEGEDDEDDDDDDD